MCLCTCTHAEIEECECFSQETTSFYTDAMACQGASGELVFLMKAKISTFL